MIVSHGTTDQPAREDAFGIGKYISGLCTFISTCDTPMTIAIQGDWGSGKTSVMEMVRTRLASMETIIADLPRKSVYTVWFNTWQYSQFNSGDVLPLSLIEALVDDLGIADGEANAKMMNSIDRIGSVLTTLGKTALVVGTERVAGRFAAEKVEKHIGAGRATGDKDEAMAFNKTIATLKARFQDCIDAAIEKNQVERIAIFVDDLDRLEPLRAVELLEVLKVFLDCERCVFILAIDYDVVVSGVQSKYGRDFDTSKGKNFFDKIIQVPFNMPVASYDIARYVKRTLEDVSGMICDANETRLIVSLINSSIGTNPRSMKRLFNSFLLLLNVLDADTLGSNARKMILFALLCMQQGFERLYNYIVINRDILDADFFERLGTHDGCAEILSNTVDAKDTNVRDLVRFMVFFVEVLDSNDIEGIDEEDMELLRELINNATIVATDIDDE